MACQPWSFAGGGVGVEGEGGPKLKQLQRRGRGVRDGRDLREPKVGTGESREPWGCPSEPSTRRAGPESRASPHSRRERRRSPAAPSEAGPGSPRPQPGPAPPLGALLGEGPRRHPTRSGGAARSRPASRREPKPGPGARARRSRGGRSGGAALAPPHPCGERGPLPAGGRGRSPRSPSPPPAPG